MRIVYSKRDMQGALPRATLDRRWVLPRTPATKMSTQNLVDSAEHLGQGKHVRTRQEKNKHNKHCEPTHPPVGACGKFLKFCELLRPNFLSKLRHWLSPSSTSSPQFTRCSIFAVLVTSLTFKTFVTFPKFPLEGVETRHVLYRFRSFHISCDLRHLLLDTNPTLL